MKEQLKIRFLQETDREEFKDWFAKTHEADTGIFDYPTLQVLTSHNGHGNISHLPMQRALVLESVASSPTATDEEKAQALRDLVKGSQLVASSHNIREIYFLATDEKVAKIALGHGFEQLPWLALRMKI